PLRLWRDCRTLLLPLHASALLERPGDARAHLRAVHQIVIGDDTRHHRLAHRHAADADAGVVAPLGHDLGVVAVAIDGLARGEDRRGRLHREARDDGLPGRDAAQNAAGVVRQEARLALVAHPHLVGIVLAAQFGSGEAVADLDALDRVDA